jgi:hypothetical protein
MWMIFISAIAGILANKSNSIVGVVGFVGVAFYGATIGWGIALATSKTIEVSAPAIVIGSICWLMIATGFYILVFRKVSYANTATLVLWGLLWAIVPPIIMVARLIGSRKKRKFQNLSNGTRLT